MRNREQYQDFLKCLNMFTEDIITKHELQSLVSDALNRHPDLQVGACSCSLTSTDLVNSLSQFQIAFLTRQVHLGTLKTLTCKQCYQSFTVRGSCAIMLESTRLEMSFGCLAHAAMPMGESADEAGSPCRSVSMTL